MEFRYALPEGEFSVQVEPASQGYEVTILRPDQPLRTCHVDARRPEHGRLTLCFGDRRLRAYVAREAGPGRSARHVAISGVNWRLEPPRPRGRRADATDGSLNAAMPGKVLDVLVEAGQSVEKSAPLIILEAMKMELRMTAPIAGVVARLFVAAGDVVAQGQKLVEIAPQPSGLGA